MRGAPRRLSTRTASPPEAVPSAIRRAAGEGSPATSGERNRKATRPAAFGGDLQPPQFGVLCRLRPDKHRAAGIRCQRLFGRPERLPRGRRAYDEKLAGIDSRSGERRRVGQVGRGDPGEPQASLASALRAQGRAGAARRCLHGRTVSRRALRRAIRRREARHRGRGIRWRSPAHRPGRSRRPARCRGDRTRKARPPWTATCGKAGVKGADG